MDLPDDPLLAGITVWCVLTSRLHLFVGCVGAATRRTTGVEFSLQRTFDQAITVQARDTAHRFCEPSTVLVAMLVRISNGFIK